MPSFDPRAGSCAAAGNSPVGLPRRHRSSHTECSSRAAGCARFRVSFRLWSMHIASASSSSRTTPSRRSRSVLDRIPASFRPRSTSCSSATTTRPTPPTRSARATSATTPSSRSRSSASARNLGYGGNQKFGYRWLIDHGFDIVVLLHGDGQYAPEVLPDIVAPLVARRGRRRPRLAHDRRGRARRRDAALQVRRQQDPDEVPERGHGLRLSEWHSGYRAFSLDAARRDPVRGEQRRLRLRHRGAAPAPRRGARIAEVPIPTYYGDEICYVDGLAYAKDVTLTSSATGCTAGIRLAAPRALVDAYALEGRAGREPPRAARLVDEQPAGARARPRLRRRAARRGAAGARATTSSASTSSSRRRSDDARRPLRRRPTSTRGCRRRSARAVRRRPRRRRARAPARSPTAARASCTTVLRPRRAARRASRTSATGTRGCGSALGPLRLRPARHPRRDPPALLHLAQLRAPRLSGRLARRAAPRHRPAARDPRPRQAVRPKGRCGRRSRRLDSAGRAVWPSLFAYQYVAVLTRDPARLPSTSPRDG